MPLVTTSLESNDWLNRLDGRRMLWLLLGLSLVIKISIWVQSPVITPDGPVYIAQAEAFLRGEWQKGLSLNNSLFIYPLLIAGLGTAGLDLLVAGRLLSLVFSVSTIIPLFMLTRQLFNARSALWASLAFIVSPSLNEYSVYVMRDPGFLCAFSWALLFALRSVAEEDIRLFLFSLVFTFLAFLFRIEAFFLPFLLVLFVFGQAVSLGRWRTPFFKQLGVFLLFSFLTAAVAGWAFSDQVLRFNRMGLIVSTMELRLNKDIFRYDPLVQEELRKMEKVLPMGAFDNDFAEIARENVRLIYLIGLLANVKKVVYPSFFVIGAAGLVFFRKYQRGHYLFFWLAAAYLLVLYLYLLHNSFIETRHVYVPIFILLPWVGYGIEGILDKLKRIQYLPRFIPMLLVVVLFSIPGVEAATDIKRQLLAAKEAGQWLADRPVINVGTLITNQPEISFYAGRGMTYLHSTSTDPVILARLANQGNAQLIAILRDLGSEPAEPDIENFLMVAKFTDKRYETLIFRNQDESSGN